MNNKLVKIAASEIIELDHAALMHAISSASWTSKGDYVYAKVLGHHIYLCHGYYTNNETRLFCDGSRVFGVRLNGRKYLNHFISAIKKAAHFNP